RASPGHARLPGRGRAPGAGERCRGRRAPGGVPRRTAVLNPVSDRAQPAEAPDPAARRRGAAGLGLIALLAVVLRVGLWLCSPDWPPLSDGEHFDRIAKSLLRGDGFGEIPGFKTSHRAPLQPVWLA